MNSVLSFVRILPIALAVHSIDTLGIEKSKAVAESFSLFFDGNSIIRIPFNPTQNNYLKTRSLTFEAWIKPMRADSRGAILNKAIGDCKDDWVLAVEGSLTPHFLCANSCTGNNRIVEKHGALSLGRWQHIAGVWDGDTIRLFVDGREVRRALFGETPSANEIDMSIGANNHWDGSNLVGFCGWIDEVRFSDVARYQSDFVPVARHRTDQHTVLLFHFDEGDSTVVRDSSNNNLTGYTKNVQWSTDIPTAEESAKTDQQAGGKSIMPYASWVSRLGLAIILVLIVLGLIWYRRRVNRTARSTNDLTGQPKSNGARIPRSSIRLLGQFGVADLQGHDISSVFAPKIQEYFLFVLIHSLSLPERPQGGVSSQKITLALWPDMDKESAKNSRNVSATKVRRLLKSIGDIQLVNTGTLTRIDIGKTVYCDLKDLTESLRNSSGVLNEREIERLVELAGSGVLLEDQDFDWLDPFRVDLRERVIKVSLRQLMTTRRKINPETALNILNSILVWDNLHEQAMIDKVLLLAYLGRPGQARDSYEKYAHEYGETMGKPFGSSFENVSAMKMTLLLL